MKHDNDPSNFLNHRRPGTLLDEERGTTYLAPPVRGGSPPRLAAHASKELNLRSNNKTNRQNMHFQPPTQPPSSPTHHRRKFSDPPAPHIKQERAENDEPSSFYVNSRGEMQPAPNRPVLAAAQILQDDEPSQFHQTTTNTLQEGGGRGGTAATVAASFDDEASTSDSIGDAWRRRRGQQEQQQERVTPIVAVAVEASAATQPQSADDPSAISFLEVSQSRVLPAGDDAHYHHDRLGPRRSQFAVRPVSGLTQASVLSERTWATHDQFRSGLALGDPIYEEATAAVAGAEQGTQEAEQEPVLAAMQQFSLAQSKLHAEQAREATDMAAQVQAVAPASIYSADPSPSPRWGQRDDSAKSVVSAPPALTTEGRSSSDGSSVPSLLPPPPRERASSASGVGAASVVSSNTAPSTDSTERLDRMKRNRVRLQRAAAVGGLVVGTVIAGPVGAVAVAAGGYAVTRVGGRRRERRLRERLQQAEHDDDDDDSSTQDETQSESQDYDIPLDNIFYTQRQTMTRQDCLRDSELEQKRLARFKPEGVQSRPTTTSFEAPPKLMSAPAVSPQSFPQVTRERLAKRSSM